MKVPDQGRIHDARAEAEALSLSRALGFETTDAVVVPFGASPISSPRTSEC
ncbi:hypothetical protein [Mesorhizobium sp. dw_380]|uniref:hypothetical protein n=1 Tax=Mesorhizobium sp. dw_380 TaxID=2812001 RepID=UPI001BDF4521|nr:hypothetical protein [Mesorhizobium sp. dw_380]